MRARALTADRKSAPLPDSTVGPEVHQPLDIHGDFTAQVAFHREFRDLRADGVHLRLGEVFHLGAGIYARTLTGGARARVADTVNVREPDPHVLVHRDVDTGDACHMSFTVPENDECAKKRGILLENEESFEQSNLALLVALIFA